MLGGADGQDAVHVTIGLLVPDGEAVAAGGRFEGVLSITNRSAVVEGYALRPLGELAGGVTIDERVVVYPADTATVPFAVVVAPAQAAGSVHLGVHVTAESRPDVATVVEATVPVGTAAALETSLSPRQSTGRRRGVHELTLHNIGNAPLDLVLGATTDGDGHAELSTHQVHVAPGEAATVRVRVEARPSALPIVIEQFRVEVHGAGPGSSVVDGTFERSRRRRGRWLPLALAAAVLLVAVVVVTRRTVGLQSGAAPGVATTVALLADASASSPTGDAKDAPPSSVSDPAPGSSDGAAPAGPGGPPRVTTTTAAPAGVPPVVRPTTAPIGPATTAVIAPAGRATTTTTGARPAPPPPTTTTTQPPPPKDRIGPGERLNVGERLVSADRRWYVILQSDGNLVGYGAGGAFWQSSTVGKGSQYLAMQQDGNLVIYSGSGAIWQTKTSGKGPGTFVIQSDRNLVVYAGGGAVWQSKTVA